MKKIQINLLVMLFASLFMANVGYSASERTILVKKVDKQIKTEKYPGVVSLYKPNYVLPYYYTDKLYQAIYFNQTPNNQSLLPEELKGQISFLVPLVRHILKDQPLSFNFAYTQLMYWQVYAKSQYFRETNYEPELFIESHFNPYVAGQIGLNHQSNGRGGELERSWNRAYVQLQFSGKNWLAHVRGWTLIGQSESSDLHNPDIAHYLGYENILFSYQFDALKASVEAQTIQPAD